MPQFAFPAGPPVARSKARAGFPGSPGLAAPWGCLACCSVGEPVNDEARRRPEDRRRMTRRDQVSRSRASSRLWIPDTGNLSPEGNEPRSTRLVDLAVSDAAMVRQELVSLPLAPVPERGIRFRHLRPCRSRGRRLSDRARNRKHGGRNELGRRAERFHVDKDEAGRQDSGPDGDHGGHERCHEHPNDHGGAAVHSCAGHHRHRPARDRDPTSDDHAPCTSGHSDTRIGAQA
jgi:hypothetical protein